VAAAPPSQAQLVLVQAAGGVTAAAVSSILTTPMDTVKTRLQV
jgi:solute carrier family 25 protein 44